ncbi:hypothetical protein IWW39_005384 [Coemansia spiralis]|uniref:Uncharacterized protein n=1 Tax=Coemansia spiralis TaxID=417178 RepID=A0A9W8L2Q5_9FUNG|nr:hypothetical protein IWW39_005384 [Coemansia spiralis]
MRFTLSIVATACLLALSNATIVAISSDRNEYFTTFDTNCHNIGTWNGANLQVMVKGSPTNFYAEPNCGRGIKAVHDRGGQWVRIDGPVSSYSVTSKSANPPMNTA